VSQKKQDTKLFIITSPKMFTDFKHSITSKFNEKFCHEVGLTHHSLNAWLCYIVIYH